jgi:hypothetical protein
MESPLTVNGLVMPPEFPAVEFEHVYRRLQRRTKTHPDLFEHFSGAWNAISFRYLALVDEGDGFTRSIASPEGAASLHERYVQERHLFGFFSNCFAAFESYFYGMFAIGAIIHPADFPMSTPRDQQGISPNAVDKAYGKSFPQDPILAAFRSVFGDTDFRQLREVRNVLTHRTAPGRRIFLSIGSDEDLPAIWKLNDIPLNSQTAQIRRSHSARILKTLLGAVAIFAQSRIS